MNLQKLENKTQIILKGKMIKNMLNSSPNTGGNNLILIIGKKTWGHIFE